MRCLFLLLFIVFFEKSVSAQNNTILNGIVRSESSELLSGVNIRVNDLKAHTQTNDQGYYSITIFSEKPLQITYSRVGFKSVTLNLGLLKNEINKQDVILFPDLRPLEEVEVKANKDNATNAVVIDVAKLQPFPSVSGNFESILKSMPGVSSNNELSSQYSVRGGNSNENLVYVNDVEIYRPLLVRNGQQEGLSFINPELVGFAKFSSGGFEARYGDKLSSVLDIKYTKPDSISYTPSVGLISSSVTFKVPFSKSYFLLGIRYKNNQSLLKSQEVKGSYQPNFSDYQLFYQQDLSTKLNFSILGNFNLSNFNLIPESRESKFGTLDKTLRLRVEYEGKEADRYKTIMGAFTLNYKPSSTSNLKWINSVFRVTEEEKFNIEGAYIFDELEATSSDRNFGEVLINRGIGSTLNYARNYLNAQVYSTELRFYKQYLHSFLESGFRLQKDVISDKLNEYTVIDSAGYILSDNSGLLGLSDVVNVKNKVNTNRISGFVQYKFDLSSKFVLSTGIRENYNSYTKEILISPRATLAYRPNNEKDLLYRISAGAYSQPPFYREFRNFDGSLNANTFSQRSYHFLSGVDYSFDGLGTKLKFTSELYYKLLDKLIPYKIENLRIRYFADQQAKGYATGAEFSLSGEFVKELQSSFSLSLMKTAEDVKDDFYLSKDENGNTNRIEPGYLKRPTDQRVNFSIFFQDRLLKNPSNKVHLSILYGSALPVGPPKEERYRDVFKIPAYKRVDMGFSKDLLETSSRRRKLYFKNFKSIVAYAEIFNLLDIHNTVSYLWIKDVDNNQYAIPNYLTSRRLNFKIIAKLNYKQ